MSRRFTLTRLMILAGAAAWTAALLGGCNIAVPDLTNAAPVADAGDDQSVAAPQTVTLDGGQSYDPDGDALTFAWRQLDGPRATINNPNQPETTCVLPEAGTYVFELTVRDGGLSGVDTVRITVGGDDGQGGDDGDDGDGDDDDGDDDDGQDGDDGGDDDDGDDDGGDDGDGNDDDGDDGDDDGDQGGGAIAGVTFRALYDWILDDDNFSEGINVVTMSGDASVVAFTNGVRDTNRKLYTIDPNGENLTPHACPDGDASLNYLDASANGDRIFAASMYDKEIYKLESGVVSTLDFNIQNGPTSLFNMQCTSDGGQVWFQDDLTLWRINHDGGGLQQILDRSGGVGAYKVWDYAISGSGARGVVIMWFSNPDKYKLYLLEGGGMSLLVDNGHTVVNPRISKDGGVIVYQDQTDGRFYRIDLDGSRTPVDIGPMGNNFGGAVLTADGGQLFYNDTTANGGRRVNTTTGAPFELMPHWNVGTITISILDGLAINDAGTMICFRHEYATFPFKRSIYVGYLDIPYAVKSPPAIQAITFNPPLMPRDGDDARVVLTVQASDPDDDIEIITPDEMLDGLKEGDQSDLAAYFYHACRDDGADPDPTADDGLWTSVGQPGGKANELNELELRVGVRDSENTVLIHDVVLEMEP